MWSLREADNFEFAYIRTLFSGFMWWNPAGIASKTPGNKGWMHIPLCKEIFKILGLTKNACHAPSERSGRFFWRIEEHDHIGTHRLVRAPPLRFCGCG